MKRSEDEDDEAPPLHSGLNTSLCARANTGLGVCVYATVAVVTTTPMATVVHCVCVCVQIVLTLDCPQTVRIL